VKVLGEFTRRDGAIHRRFTRSERKMIANLAGGLAETLDQAGELDSYEDPVLLRLLPVAAPDDPDASAEFASATRERLAGGKAEGARRLVADLEAAPDGRVRLDDDEAVVWLKALGDLRLALAERVGFESLQASHGPQAVIYGWLTWLQGSLVEALEDRPDA